MGVGVEPRTPQNLRCIPGRPFTPRFSRGVYPEAPVLGAEGFAFHAQVESAPPAPPPRFCPSRPSGGIIAQAATPRQVQACRGGRPERVPRLRDESKGRPLSPSSAAPRQRPQVPGRPQATPAGGAHSNRASHNPDFHDGGKWHRPTKALLPPLFFSGWRLEAGCGRPGGEKPPLHGPPEKSVV